MRLTVLHDSQSAWKNLTAETEVCKSVEKKFFDKAKTLHDFLFMFLSMIKCKPIIIILILKFELFFESGNISMDLSLFVWIYNTTSWKSLFSMIKET